MFLTGPTDEADNRQQRTLRILLLVCLCVCACAYECVTVCVCVCVCDINSMCVSVPNVLYSVYI